MEQEWSVFFFQRGVPDDKKESLQRVREAFAALANTLQQELPSGRYKSIVKTDLEKIAAISTKSYTHEGL